MRPTTRTVRLQFRGIYVAGKPDGPFESYYEKRSVEGQKHLHGW